MSYYCEIHENRPLWSGILKKTNGLSINELLNSKTNKKQTTGMIYPLDIYDFEG